MSSSSDERAREALLADAMTWRRRAGRVDAVEADLERFRSRASELSRELKAAQRESASNARRATTAEQQLAAAEARIVAAEEAAAAGDERFAALQAELGRVEAKQDKLLADARAAAGETNKLRRDRDEFRDRLQRQYNMRWSRLGNVLREARHKPQRLPALPVKIVREMRRTPPLPTPGKSKSKSKKGERAATALTGDQLIEGWLLGGDNDVAVTVPDTATERFSRIAHRLLERRDNTTADALFKGAVRRQQAMWLAEQLDDIVLPPVSPGIYLDFVEQLHDAGEIDRPIELLARPDAPTSERLDELLAKRRREQRILAEGIRPAAPTMRRPATRSVDAFYLLHNSLPHQSGGYATRTHGLLTGLNAAGRSVVGVTRPGFPSDGGVFRQRDGLDPHDVIDGVRYERLIGPVEALPRTNLDGFVATYAQMLQPLVDELGPRLLHGASNWWNGHAATAIARALDVPSIYEVRGLWEVTRASRELEWAGSELYQLDARYEAEAAKAADRVIAITGGLRDELVRRGVDESKISLAPNAVDVDRFSVDDPDQSLLAELDLEGRCVLGFVGSVTFYEGLDDLLHSLALLRDRTRTPVAFLLVGDGPFLPELESLAAELGVEDLCRFVGRVPHAEVRRYLSVIDITPFPRKPLPVCEMVSPLKPLESMASGLPVVVSAVQALAEMVPGDDVEALTDALAELADDPVRRRSMAANAREWVVEERSWAKISGRVAAIYAELLD